MMVAFIFTIGANSGRCYMFEAVDIPNHPDEWFDKNKAENEKM